MAPETVLFVDEQDDWTMTIGQGSPDSVFRFLEKYLNRKVYMAVSYNKRV